MTTARQRGVDACCNIRLTMAEVKTKPTKERVSAFLKRATDGERRKDSMTLVRMMQDASGARGVMWGPGIVGFGLHEIPYADGRTAEWPVIAFAPRKDALTLYVSRRLEGLDVLRGKLGKHKMSGGCLHIKRLSDVDMAVLAKVIAKSIKATTRKRR
jgi:hypothetical protein